MKAALGMTLVMASMFISGKPEKVPQSDTTVPKSKWTFTTKKPAIPYATGRIAPPTPAIGHPLRSR